MDKTFRSDEVFDWRALRPSIDKDGRGVWVDYKGTALRTPEKWATLLLVCPKHKKPETLVRLTRVNLAEPFTESERLWWVGNFGDVPPKDIVDVFGKYLWLPEGRPHGKNWRKTATIEGKHIRETDTDTFNSGETPVTIDEERIAFEKQLELDKANMEKLLDSEEKMWHSVKTDEERKEINKRIATIEEELKKLEKELEKTAVIDWECFTSLPHWDNTWRRPRKVSTPWKFLDELPRALFMPEAMGRHYSERPKRKPSHSNNKSALFQVKPLWVLGKMVFKKNPLSLQDFVIGYECAAQGCKVKGSMNLADPDISHSLDVWAIQGKKSLPVPN